MIILYFRLFIFMVQIVLYFQHSTSVLSFDIDVVLTLSILIDKIVCFIEFQTELQIAYHVIFSVEAGGHLTFWVRFEWLNYFLTSEMDSAYPKP